MLRGFAICLIALGFTSGFAQINAPQLELFGVKEGLVANVIRTVLPDSRGFIWIGTQAGLQRYDGYTLRSFLPDESQPGSIKGQTILCMYEDARGDIWIGTRLGGLSRFDRQTEQFQNYPMAFQDSLGLKGRHVSVIMEDRGGRLWLGTTQGLSWAERDPDDPSRILHFHAYPDARDDSLGMPVGHVAALAQDSTGAIWATIAKKGLFRLPVSQQQLSPAAARFDFFTHKSDLFPSESGGPMLVLKNGDIWMGTNNGGFRIESAEVESDTPAIKHYGAERFPPVRQNSDVISGIIESPNGDLWISSTYGIHYWKADQDRIQSFTLEECGISGGGFNALLGIKSDRYGGMWACTFEGLGKPQSKLTHFNGYDLEGWPDYEELPTNIRGVHRDQHGQIWMGVENAGVFVLAPSGQAYKQIQLSGPNPNLNYQFIMVIREDHQGHIWVGTYGGGLHELIPSRAPDGRVVSYRSRGYFPGSDPRTPGAYYIYDIFEDSQKRLWIADFYSLSYFDRAANEFFRYEVPVANEVLEDQQGRIWVGSDEGLYWLDEATDSLRHFVVESDSLFDFSTARVETFIEDRQGIFWIGTMRGLFRLDPNTKALTRYLEKDGLSGRQIRTLAEDSRGYIWIGSQRGLTRLDPKTLHAYTFTEEDGILNFTFINRSVHAGQGGPIFMGGNVGLLGFNPDSIQPPRQAPVVRLTGFQLFNEPVPIASANKGMFSLPSSITELTTLDLTYHQDVFSFEFAALSYRNPQRIRYAYQMEGFDQNWRYTDASQRKATYTNLDPGSYTFRVKAAYPDGEWGEAPPLVVHIRPPWWRHPIAYLLYGLLAASSIYTFIRYRTRKVRLEMRTQARIEQAKLLERERVRAQSSRDFHDEAGNHLTKISLYTGLIKRDLDEAHPDQEYLSHIEDNLKSLSGGMRDFIWVLDPQQDQLQDTVQRIVDFGYALFQHSNTEFVPQVKLPEDLYLRLEVPTKRNLLLIFKEAMHNALKYASASQVRFVVSWNQADGLLHLELRDDGLGFERAKLSRINGLSNMQKRAAEMGAEFKLEAFPGLGTRIHLTLPDS